MDYIAKSVNPPDENGALSARKFSVSPYFRVFLLFFLFFLYIFYPVMSFSNGCFFAFLNLFFAVYLLIELKVLWRFKKEFFLINPVVSASLFTFFLSFCLTNIIFLLPEDMLGLTGLTPEIFIWMNKLMLLVLTGCVAMWTGYYSRAGREFADFVKTRPFMKKYVRKTPVLNMKTIYALVFISLFFRLWAIKLGIYGYSSTYDQLSAEGAYTMYFNMAGTLGTIALVAVAVKAFSSDPVLFRDKIILTLIVIYEVAFGFLSGFKTQVAMPFIIVGLVYYARKNIFPKKAFLLAVIALVAAYSIIEPFRRARYREAAFEGTDISSIAGTLATAYKNDYRVTAEKAPMALAIAARFNYTYIASLGIEYAEKNKLSENSPDFLGNLILSPLHAVVPRFIWRSKPVQEIGLWYTNEVRGFNTDRTSTGMSPFTYLNFAGGLTAVIAGFFILGVFQRGLFDGLLYFGSGGLIVFLGLFSTLVLVDSAFNAIFVNIFRYFPVLVAAQYVLFKSSKKAGGEAA